MAKAQAARKTSRSSSARPQRRTALKKAPRRARTSARTQRAPASDIKATNLSPEDRRFISRYRDCLSPATLRAKWVHSADEHEDRSGQSLATRSREVIQHWCEERGAQPATVTGSRYGDRVGVLRFDFPGYGGGKRLQTISWDEWFKSFDSRKLVFVFQEHKANGVQSNFFRLDSPERESA